MIFNMGGGGVVPKYNKDAATITPGTSDQVIPVGTYLRGDLTISGDRDLISSNIKKGVNIFGIEGEVNDGGFGGVWFESVDENGNPINLKIKGSVNAVGVDLSSCEYVEIDKNESLPTGFLDCNTSRGKIKLKNVEEIKAKAFKNIALNSKTEVTKLFIPSTVLTIPRRCFLCESISYGSAENLLIYCEHSSAPSGFDSSWNQIAISSSSYANVTVTWGVTESQFDAL